MWQLVKRLAVFAVLVTIVVVAGSWSWKELLRRRNPQRAVAKQLLEMRLGSMTPEQRRLADKALKRDPMMAVLAAQDGGWEGVEYFVKSGPDDILKIERLALSAGLQGSIDQGAAARFADAAFSQLVVLEHINDPKAATSLRNDLAAFSPTEYKNIGFDASYLLIAPKLTAKHRETFRQYQDVLTPLILAADPTEWDPLVNRFEKALPRVAAIARDKKNLGELYAWVYMLHAEIVEALLKVLPPSEEGQQLRDVLDFVGVNASVLMKSGLTPAIIADQVNRLRGEYGPDGSRSLFEWACMDGTVYWFIAEMQRTAPELGRETAFQNAVTILKCYAGTELPAILTRYADDPDSFQAATKALLRFDNFDDPDESRRQSAAKFLNHYQKDSVFKKELAKHGAKLIPALSAGGENALSAISRNPKDIDKYVTEEGVSITGKPWWTWVPGGNLLYLGREIVADRSTETSDWVWAGVDVIIFVPWVKGAAVPVRMAPSAGQNAAVRVIARGSEQVGKEIAAKTVGRATLEESLILLQNAGIKVANGSLSVANWTAKNSGKAAFLAGGTTAGLCALYPDEAADIIDNGSRWVTKRLEALAHESGRAIASLPGETIKGVWSKMEELAAEEPLLAPIFYLLAAVLSVVVLLLPLCLLKWLIPETYQFLKYFVVETFRAIGRFVAWSANRAARAIRPTS